MHITNEETIRILNNVLSKFILQESKRNAIIDPYVGILSGRVIPSRIPARLVLGGEVEETSMADALVRDVKNCLLLDGRSVVKHVCAYKSGNGILLSVIVAPSESSNTIGLMKHLLWRRGYKLHAFKYYRPEWCVYLFIPKDI